MKPIYYCVKQGDVEVNLIRELHKTSDELMVKFFPDNEKGSLEWKTTKCELLIYRYKLELKLYNSRLSRISSNINNGDIRFIVFNINGLWSMSGHS